MVEGCLGRNISMQEKSIALHPRPQLTRAFWVDLGGAWGFAYDFAPLLLPLPASNARKQDAGRGLFAPLARKQDEGWQERADVYTRTIQVPFPPESPASGIGD